MKQFLTHPLVSFILKILVSLCLFLGLLYYIDIKTIVNSFKNANSILLIGGFLLTVINMGIHFIRWRYLLRLISPDIKNEDVFTSLFVGITAGFFTPGQIGEIAGRIACLPTIRKSHIAGMTLIDKLYLLSLTVVMGIIPLAVFIFLYLNSYWHFLYSILAVVVSMIFSLIFLFPKNSKKLFSFIPQKIRNSRLYHVIDIIETQFHNKEGRVLFLLTALLYTMIFFQFFIFVLTFQPISLWGSLMCASAIYFVKAIVLPISFGDLGVRESAAIFFFGKLGITAAAAFSASFCMFLANIFLPSVVGALMVLKLKTK